MSYPTSPEFNAIAIESNSPTLSSTSVNGRIQSRKIGGQKWTFTANYPPMTQAEFKPVWAYIVSKQGSHGVFTIVPPIVASTGGTGTGTVTCTSAAIGATAITIASLTGTLKAGDFVKFANHTKVYMLTADRDGAGAIAIEPPLVAALSSNEQMTYANVPFTVRLANDLQKYKLGAGQLYRFEVDFVEAL